MSTERSQKPKTGKLDGKAKHDPFGPTDIDPFGPSDPSDPFSLSGESAFGIDKDRNSDNELCVASDDLSQDVSVDSSSYNAGTFLADDDVPKEDESFSVSKSEPVDDGQPDDTEKPNKKGRLVRKRRRRSYGLGSTITLRDLYETVTSVTLDDMVFFLRNQFYNWLAFALMAAIASLVVKFNC